MPLGHLWNIVINLERITITNLAQHVRLLNKVNDFITIDWNRPLFQILRSENEDGCTIKRYSETYMSALGHVMLTKRSLVYQKVTSNYMLHHVFTNSLVQAG